jgi:hypothetical protein
MKRANAFLRSIRWIIGLALLGYLVYAVKPAALLEVLLRVDFALVPVWLGLYLVCLTMGALNIYLLLRPYSTVSFATLLRYDLVATSLGYFTPAQIGAPVAFALSLKKEYGILYSRSVSALLLDKVNTFLVTFAFGIVGVVRAVDFSAAGIELAADMERHFSLVGILLAFLVLTVIVLLYRRSKRIRKISSDVLTALGSYRTQKRCVFLNLVLTIVLQGAFALLWIVTFSMIGHTVGFSAMITTVPAVSLVAYVPITIGGVGTQELSALFLWRAIGITAEIGLASYLVSRAMTIAISIILLVLAAVIWPSTGLRSSRSVDMTEGADGEE